MRRFSLLIIILMLCSCSYIYTPKEFEVLEGENCLVICDGELTSEQYKEVLTFADTAYKQMESMTCIQLNIKIAVFFDDLNLSESLGAATINNIYLDGQSFFALPTEELYYVLRHEMTHLFFDAKYGATTSFLFSEGIAEYYGNSKSADSVHSSGLDLADWVGFSYYDYFLNDSDYEEIISEIYSLSHSFIYYWCSKYGEQSIKELYAEITAENIIDKLEGYSHAAFDEIVYEFKNRSGEI